MKIEDDSSRVLTGLAATGATVGVADILAACWRGRVIVAIAAVIGAVVGGVMGLRLPPRYEAVTSFRVLERAGQDKGLRTFQTLLESNALAEDVVRAHKLAAPPENLTAATFESDHLLVEQVKDTNLLRAHVMLPDPRLAAAVANTLAARAVERYRALSAGEAQYTPEVDAAAVKSQLDKATAARDALEAELLAYRSKAQIDVLQSQANDIVNAERRLTDIERLIPVERRRLAAIESEQRQPAEDGRRVAGSPADQSLLNTEIAMMRADILGREAERDDLSEHLKAAGAASDAFARLYDRQMHASRIERELQAAESVVASMRSRYDQFRNSPAVLPTQPEVIDPATVPGQSLSRRPLALAIAGAIVGLLAALAYVIAARLVVPMIKAGSAEFVQL